MTGRGHKSATVAAVLAAVAAFLALGDRSAEAASAVTDLPATFDQARVLHVKGRQYFPGQRQENGSPIPPVDIEIWIDRQGGRTRHTQTALSHRSQMSSSAGAGASTTVTVTETICDGTYQMTVNHTAKTVTFSHLGEYHRDLAAYRLSQKLWSQLCGQATPWESFTKAGRETLNGRPCDVWQVDAPHTLGDGSGGIRGMSGRMGASGRGPRGAFPGLPSYSTRSKLWLSADDGRLVRAQALSRMPNAPWELQSDFSTIECDAQVPPGTFATEPPAGYTARNSKTAAPPANLRSGGVRITANGRSLECGVLIAFTLSDDSVVAGWHARAGSEGSQEPLFARLAFGGPLPKLPVEIYGLRPAGSASGITYTGRHLGYTRQADRFTEWSLFTPSGTPPAIVKQAGYHALYRFHLDPKPTAQFGLTAEYGVPIRTAEDFDKWVRGAMAEFSDSGTPPPDVTWQRVVDLARQARNP